MLPSGSSLFPCSLWARSELTAQTRAGAGAIGRRPHHKWALWLAPGIPRLCPQQVSTLKVRTSKMMILNRVFQATSDPSSCPTA